MGRRHHHALQVDAISQELADLEDARAAVAAIVAERTPPGPHSANVRKLTPSRSRLMVWCVWLGFSKADIACAKFRSPIRVAADVSHAIRQLVPSAPSALGLAVAVLESCNIELDAASIAALCMFAQQCRFPRRVS
jgi:hypothetical protein